MNATKLDIKEIMCFGFTSPKTKCWLTNVDKLPQIRNDLKAYNFSSSLIENVKFAYSTLAKIRFIDLGSETEYIASFAPADKVWKLEIANSPKAEVSQEEKREFFRSDLFKRLGARFEDIFKDALDAWENRGVKDLIESGELIELDEIKLEAVIHFLENPLIRKNLRLGKFEI